MVVENLPGVFVPPPPETVIWRAMDLWKLKDLLDTGELFLTRADTFKDAYEGRLPAANRKVGFLGSPLLKYDPDMPSGDKYFAIKASWYDQWRKHMCVSSWYCGTMPPNRIWREYVSSPPGIAILSDVSALSGCVHDAPHRMFLGVVDYQSIEEVPIDEMNLYHAVLRKQPSYDWESEIRLVVNAMPEPLQPDSFSQHHVEKGLRLSIDVSQMIRGLVLDPRSTPAHADVVRALAARHGLPSPEPWPGEPFAQLSNDGLQQPVASY